MRSDDGGLLAIFAGVAEGERPRHGEGGAEGETHHIAESEDALVDEFGVGFAAGDLGGESGEPETRI